MNHGVIFEHKTIVKNVCAFNNPFLIAFFEIDMSLYEIKGTKIT